MRVIPFTALVLSAMVAGGLGGATSSTPQLEERARIQSARAGGLGGATSSTPQLEERARIQSARAGGLGGATSSTPQLEERARIQSARADDDWPDWRGPQHRKSVVEEQ